MLNTARPEASVIQNHAYFTAAVLGGLQHVTPESTSARLLGLGMTREYDEVLAPTAWRQLFVSGTLLPQTWKADPIGGGRRVVLGESLALDLHHFWLTEDKDYATVWADFVPGYLHSCPAALRPTQSAGGRPMWHPRAMDAALSAFKRGSSGDSDAVRWLRHGCSMQAEEYSGVSVGGVKLKSASADNGARDSCFVCVPDGDDPTLWFGVVTRVLRLAGPQPAANVDARTALVVAAEWYPCKVKPRGGLDLDFRINVPKTSFLPVVAPNGRFWRAKHIIPTHLFLVQSPWDHRCKLAMHRDGTLHLTLRME